MSLETQTDAIAQLSCTEFVEALASKAPVPGGGAAAALVGAIGMALGTMVGSLTLGKAKYADVQDDITELMSSASALQTRLLELAEADARAFEPLARAYSMPKDSDEQRVEKERVMQACLRACCEVPLEIMQSCCEAIELHEEFAAKGSALAISDVGCGLACCKAALQAASLNVFINTKAMEDREFALKTNARAHALLCIYEKKADEVFASVAARFD
ncbi:MAG: cyclodeaminase/cyclohydrolase family protein [Eggerthellaceae bacterium]|nr:cyclodeaminase/cyclohydrolase family protein [Eggerthellaceae bacterium]